MKRTIDVVIGGQYGSEGKGLVAAKLAKINKYDTIISVNSAQAGHTAPLFDGDDNFMQQVVTRHIPSGAITDFDAIICIGAGAIINPKILIDEIGMLESLGIPIKNRLYISAFATVITHENEEWEKEHLPWQSTGSTQEGIGAALSMRALRKATIVKDVPELSRYCVLDIHMHYGRTVLLEGSQGFGLSVLGAHYPKTTSRDTTTQAFLSYAQLPWSQVRDVYGVFRTFPIRVAGESGGMYQELSWERVSEMSGYSDLREITTVTKRQRRIGSWDMELYRRSCEQNGVTIPCFTFLNYLGKENEKAIHLHELNQKARDFIVANLMASGNLKCYWSVNAVDDLVRY